MKSQKEKLGHIINQIKNCKPGIHKMNVGASNEDIDAAERELNVKLPALYREFLQVYNGGELFALPTGTKLLKVKAKIEEKKIGVGYINDDFNPKKRWPNMPKNFLDIANTNYGDCICIDIETITEEDAVVVQWDHEEGRVSRFWEGITEWLEEELSEGSNLID